jgi:hypothetical protein
VRQIFDKWELSEIKGQKGDKAKKKGSKTGDAKMPFEDMKLTEWRHMQALKDPEMICPVLQRVLTKELSLQEMGQEFQRHKFQMQVQKAFLTCLHEESWGACKTKYPEHCTDNVLKNFVPVFQTWVSSLNSLLIGLFDPSLFGVFNSNNMCFVL